MIDDLRSEILADPDLLALLPDSEAIAAALPPRITIGEAFVTERGVVAALGIEPGEAFLKALEDFAESTAEHPLATHRPAIRRQIAWLKRDGIDVGSTPARVMISALVTTGVLNEAAADTILRLAEVHTQVTEFEVRQAIWNDDGSQAV